MADKETEAEWEKSMRIEAEKMKAARSLAYHEEDKTNQAFLDPAKVRGFSRDPNVVARSAERLANISIVFTLLGILFGIFLQLVSIEIETFRLGLAGSGIAMVFGAINSVGIGVGALTGAIALVCGVVMLKRTARKLKPAIITAVISLTLIIIYYIVQYLIIR